MQTFLPFPDFKKSAQTLDFRRLGKQRVECLTIISGKWKNHPVSKMWMGHYYQLCQYGIVVCEEWIFRGYRDTCLLKIKEYQKEFNDTGLPYWFGDPVFHLAHQSNLIRKDKMFYQNKFPFGTPNNLSYIYPPKKMKENIYL